MKLVKITPESVDKCKEIYINDIFFGVEESRIPFISNEVAVNYVLDKATKKKGE